MNIQKNSLETKRLLLRKAKVGDYQLLYDNFWSDDDGWKYMLWRPIDSLTEAKEKIKEFIEKQKRSPRFLVVEKKTNMPIGIASIILREDKSVKDIAIGIGSKFRGQKYGYEISKALMTYCFEILGEDEIFTTCMVDDKHTYELQKELGMTERGISARQYTRNWDGLAYNKYKFHMTLDQWNKIKKKEKGFLGLFKKKV